MDNYTSQLFSDTNAHLCRIMARIGGLQYALQGLLNLISTERPVVRVNVTYCTNNSSAFISLGDTKHGRPLSTKFSIPGKQTPILLPERINEDMIVGDLAPYKLPNMQKDPVFADLPFMSHSSLLRLSLLHSGNYVLLFNFWSDDPGAFHENDIDDFRLLALPVAEEFRAELPDIYDDRLVMHGNRELGATGRLKMCAGLVPVLRQVEQLAGTNYTVLITGETGVGKESVAEAIHELSQRGKGPLIKVNCAAIPETLVDSELFGYEKGAFTGAIATKPGYFELARGGTIFLDEIGDMPLSAQARLLRVLDRGIITRVGGALPISLDIRVVAATNVDLPARVMEGTFRKDLWYRISGHCIHVPPLRERHGDIPALVNYFARMKDLQHGKYPSARVTKVELDRLHKHSWPGNVRELEHVVERALLQAKGSNALHFEIDDRANLLDGKKRQGVFEGWPSIGELENRYIQMVLQHCQGKMMGRNGAASILGIHYTTLRNKMQQLGLPLPRSKQGS